MPVTQIDWDPLEVNPVPAGHKVYLRENWSDAWAEVDFLRATEVVWSTAPQTSRASLYWRAGWSPVGPDGNFRGAVDFLDRERWFVKIELDTVTVRAGQPSKLEWYGSIEVDNTELGGVSPPDNIPDPIAHGTQQLVCYGLEAFLQRHRLSSSSWLDVSAGQIVRTIDRPLTFNANGEKNKRKINFVFPHFVSHEESNDTEADYWSTRDIVEYLLKYQTPKTKNGDAVPEFVLDSALRNLLPDWDRPVLRQERQTTWGLLTQLLSQSQLLGFYCEVDGLLNRVELKPFTFVGQTVTTTDGVVLENPTQWRMNLEEDDSASITKKKTSFEKVDRVRYVGARRRSCFTVSIADENFETRWLADRQTEYETGASNQADYQSLAVEDVHQKRQKNDTVRAQEKYDNVFARFGIVDDWDLLSYDGSGDGDPNTDFKPVFPDDDDRLNIAKKYRVYDREIYVLPTLPLLSGYEYHQFVAAPTEIDDPPHRELTPQVFVKPEPDVEEFVRLDRVATLGGYDSERTDRSWSGEVFPIDRTRMVKVRIHGREQHVWAFSDFVPLDVDEVSNIDYQDARWTIAVADDRFCEGVYPAPANLPANAEIREHVVYAGDDYRLDYLAPNTVVGVDPDDLSLQINTGGGYIRDDRDTLTSKAEAAFAFMNKERVALAISTNMISTAVSRGDFVAEIGGEITYETNSVITEIRVEFPMAEGDATAQPAKQFYATGHLERDGVRLA